MACLFDEGGSGTSSGPTSLPRRGLSAATAATIRQEAADRAESNCQCRRERISHQRYRICARPSAGPGITRPGFHPVRQQVFGSWSRRGSASRSILPTTVKRRMQLRGGLKPQPPLQELWIALQTCRETLGRAGRSEAAFWLSVPQVTVTTLSAQMITMEGEGSDVME